jgi:hypothetical protein
MLLATFANPKPAAYAYFGWSVSGVSSTRVLIGAYQDSTGATHNGAAYLFSTNGTLLSAITNPAPAANNYFGSSVAAVGTDRVIVGAPFEDVGIAKSGSAFMFGLPYPPLMIAANKASVSISWVAPETGLILEQADLLGVQTAWNDTTNSVSINGLTNVVQQPIVGATNRFFRLHRP